MASIYEHFSSKAALEAAMISQGFEEQGAQWEAALETSEAVFAFAHGMTILELNGRFPADADLDAAWRRGLAALQAPLPPAAAEYERSS